MTAETQKLQKIRLIQGDISKQNVDAIVNAANAQLAGGGGVDGAIHRAAGAQKLMAYTDEHFPDGCPTGSCVATPGFALPAKRILHCVGPAWDGGINREERLLAKTYNTAMELARANKCRTIAFPAISTGVYRFPARKAARIAVKAVLEVLDDDFDEIRFVCFDDQMAEVYWNRLTDIGWEGVVEVCDMSRSGSGN